MQSTYTEGPTQIDGRRYVKERHVDDEGHVYEFEWLGAQDAALVLSARAEVLGAQITEQQQAVEFVSGTKLPITKLAFRGLFTGAEKQAIDAFNATFEAHPTLTTGQKAEIRTGLEDFKMAENIALPFDTRVQNMLGLYVSLELLSADRMATIIGTGN